MDDCKGTEIMPRSNALPGNEKAGAAATLSVVCCLSSSDLWNRPFRGQFHGMQANAPDRKPGRCSSTAASMPGLVSRVRCQHKKGRIGPAP